MSNQLEIRHIKYFLAVAEDLHFRKAAERLYISQPGLSRQIKQMEEDLGLQLFDRHNRKVVLTNTGLYLKNELSRNLKQLSDIIDHAKLLHEGKKGRVKLGYVGSAMQKIIPDLLINYRLKNPDIIFSLKEMDNQKQIEELLSFNIDIGFVRLEKVPKTISKFSVLSDTFCLVLPEHHLVNSNNFKNLSQFKNESFILFDPEYSESYYNKVLEIFHESGFSPLISHLTIHASSIYKLVENNFGISIVPKSLTLNNPKGVKFIELNLISQRTDLFLAWNKMNRNPLLNEVLNLFDEFSDFK